MTSQASLPFLRTRKRAVVRSEWNETDGSVNRFIYWLVGFCELRLSNKRWCATLFHKICWEETSMPVLKRNIWHMPLYQGWRCHISYLSGDISLSHTYVLWIYDDICLIVFIDGLSIRDIYVFPSNVHIMNIWKLHMCTYITFAYGWEGKRMKEREKPRT